MKLLELWIARYTSKGKPWGNILPWPDSPRIKPRDYDDWDFWQWSADGNGRGAEFGASSRSIDLNYFNGDQVAFDEYIGKSPIYTFPPSIGVKIDIDGVKYHGHIDKV
jgi:GH25 family lysozyme M1 (1,4-beta-N-acetylmuramidase)